MLKRHAIGFGLFVSMMVIGCRVDFTAELQAVDSLLGVVGKVERSSASIDPRLVQQYVKNIREKCSKIQKEKADTMNLQEAQTLVDFCALEEHLESCLERKVLIDSELQTTRNQLFNLKTDLQQKLIDKDSVNRFIETEFQFVESLDEGTDNIIAEMNGCFATYTELKDEIDRLVISLPPNISE